MAASERTCSVPALRFSFADCRQRQGTMVTALVPHRYRVSVVLLALFELWFAHAALFLAAVLVPPSWASIRCPADCPPWHLPYQRHVRLHLWLLAVLLQVVPEQLQPSYSAHRRVQVRHRLRRHDRPTVLCTNDCSGNGVCADRQCQCNAGWTGHDCSLRTCPHDRARHGQCYNGTCYCDAGYFGADC